MDFPSLLMDGSGTHGWKSSKDLYQLMRMYIKKTAEDGFILSATRFYMNKYQTNLFVHPQLLFRELLPIASHHPMRRILVRKCASQKAFYKGPL